MDTPVWDRFERARSPAQVLADLQAQAQPMQPPQTYVTPAWQVRENLSRMTAEISHPELMVLRSGVQEPDGVPSPSERMATMRQHTRIEKLKAAARNGNRDAAVAWAKELFPNGIGKPDHGPEHY